MGFYLRKSIRVGPLRFNLSNSGVGVSAGVRGFRVGTGPRGNYVHMGVGGIYYRATIPSAAPRGRAALHSRTGAPAAFLSDPPIPPGTHEELRDIDSVSASAIVDSSSAELLREINEKKQKVRLWPLALTATILAPLAVLAMDLTPWLAVSVAIIGAAATAFAYRRDLLAKTVVLFYSMDQEMETTYGILHEWASHLSSCARAWHIAAQGQVYDRKYHAGASSLVRRNPTFIRKAEPPYLKTNIETVAMGVGTQVLHFFPDRVLIYDTKGVGAVAYSQLQLTVQPTRFIEDQSVPPDTQVVDHTWKFVNKRGGPDRRFKDNRQLPICLYDEISLSSSTGLNEVIQVSRVGVADGFAKAIQFLASKIPPELQCRSV